MPRDDAVLLDIVHASRLILNFIKGMTKEEFLEEPKTQSAVLHKLMIIGEAVKRLSTEFRSKHTDVPWALIAGMRDNLIHAYDAVDLDEVWKTATSDIPDLLDKIEPLTVNKGTR